MALAVGVPGKLRYSAEVEPGLPRLTDGPAAVSALKFEERFRLAGFARFLESLGHIDPAAHARSRCSLTAQRVRWQGSGFRDIPVLGENQRWIRQWRPRFDRLGLVRSDRSNTTDHSTMDPKSRQSAWKPAVVVESGSSPVSRSLRSRSARKRLRARHRSRRVLQARDRRPRRERRATRERQQRIVPPPTKIVVGNERRALAARGRQARTSHHLFRGIS